MSRTSIPPPSLWQYQWTLKTPVGLSGRGLHTGEPASVTFHPAEENGGIVFLCSDGPAPVRIPALARYVADTTLSTTLFHKNTLLRTVEHVLAAVYGLGITNLAIEVRGEEVPAADGSAAQYSDLLLEAGIQVQSSPRRILGIDRPCWVAEEDKFVIAWPDERPNLTYVTDYNRPFAGPMLYQTQLDPERFYREIAGARTFCFRDELEELFRRGLGLGGTLDNAVVIDATGYSSPLRYPDEPVRHKMLDLIGDLALVGGALQATVVAVKAGHALHTKLVRQLLKRVRILAASTTDWPQPVREVSQG